jgi:hypothetical protein
MVKELGREIERNYLEWTMITGEWYSQAITICNVSDHAALVERSVK